MLDLFHLFLYLHIIGAIIAFGPGFANPLSGSMAGKEPQHANFMMRVNDRITDRIVIPVALTMALTGAGLIWVGPFDVFKEPWLVLGIVVYVVTVAFAIVVQRASVKRVIELTARPPGPPAGAPGAAAGTPPPGPPTGPPPEVAAAVRRVKMGGMGLGVAVLFIAFLMIFKPLAS